MSSGLPEAEGRADMADHHQPDLLHYVRPHPRVRLGRIEHVRGYWKAARKPKPRQRAKSRTTQRMVIVFL